MKVILLKELRGKGGEGDVIDVARGYANNYLLTQGYAVKATQGNLKQLEQRKNNIAKREETRIAQANDLAEKLNDATVIINARIGEGGQLFGSITSPMIAAAIKESLDIDVDRHRIELKKPIKAVGEYPVAVTLYRDIKAVVNINVKGEEAVGAEATDKTAAKEATEEVAEVADAAAVAEDVAADATAEAAEEAADAVTETANVAADAVADTVAESVADAEDVAADVAEKAVDTVAETAEVSADAVADAVAEAEDVAADAVAEADEAASDAVADTVAESVAEAEDVAVDTAVDAVDAVTDAAAEVADTAADVAAEAAADAVVDSEFADAALDESAEVLTHKEAE